MGGVATSRWAANGAIRLHYLDARPSAPGPAVVVVPGFGEDTEDHRPLLDAVAPRRALVVDLRGRGRSTPADDGYGLADHAADMAAVVEDAAVERVHLVSYSRGTTYGLAWAFSDVDRIASLTIGDYPPAQLVPPADLAETAARRRWRQRPMTDRMPVPAIAAMVRAATAFDWWGEMAAVRVPVMVIRAGTGGMIDDDLEARYRQTVRDLRMITFTDSGHDLWSPDPDRFGRTLASFLDDVDRRGPAPQP